MPVPFSAMTVGEFVALLVKDRVPEVAPLELGVNVTVNEADEPAPIVTGSEIPDRVNSLFVMLADETVTAAPVAVRVPLREELDPTATFPKFIVTGDAVN